MFDLVIAVEGKYVNPSKVDWYTQNILDENLLISNAAKELGISVTKVSWDDPNFDWKNAKAVLIRETWDYFHRISEFMEWVSKVEQESRLINSAELIRWNQDKHYLLDAQQNGVEIVPTRYIEKGETASLKEIYESTSWSTIILKPCISGAARHTYKLNARSVQEHEAIFRELIVNESMMIQPFIESITEKGEISFILINGKFEHAVLKKAKPGDFRVQDDWGGTLHDFTPSSDMIRLAQDVLLKAAPNAIYARVDMVWGDDDHLLLGELELIEPELWFRRNPTAANNLALRIKQLIY